MKGRIWGVAVAAALLLTVPSALGSHTPPPTGVTIAGSLQSELGCPGDWDPACAATAPRLRRRRRRLAGHVRRSRPALGVQGRRSTTLGRELRRARGARTAPTSRCRWPRRRAVKFYYDHETPLGHGQRSPRRSRPRPAASRASSAAPGDWDPGCLRSWLQDPDGDGIYTFVDDRPARRELRGEGRDQRVAGTRTTGRAARRTARTSRSRSRAPARRSRSPTSPSTHVLTIR